MNYAYLAEGENSSTSKVLLCLKNLVKNCDKIRN